MTELHLPIPLGEDLTEEARRYVSASRAANTRRAYRSDWRRFEAWCAARAAGAMPAAPATVANYLAAHAGAKSCATLKRWRNSISQAHAAAGQADPCLSYVVDLTWKGIRNTHGAPSKSKAALRVEDLRRICDALPATLIGARDRALLLVGFSCALRRSELVALHLEHLVEDERGLLVTIARSKTDQEGKGAVVDVPLGSCETTCPVRAVRAWRDALASRGVTSGPVFRSVDRHGNVSHAALSGYAVALIVKRHAAAVGLNAESFGGHSLRRGFATSAARAGVEERDIQRRGRWKSAQVARRYIDEADRFTNPAGAIL